MIPDVSVSDNSRTEYQHMQKRLLLIFDNHNVLDSLVLLTMEMTTSLTRKLVFEVVEINYHIFKGLSPE